MKENNDIDIYIRLFIPILTILICMASLCLSTWAWYTESISTGINVIKAQASESTISINDGSVPADESGYYTLEANTEYTVFIRNDGTSSSGYHCLVTVFKEDNSIAGTFYTAKIGIDGITFYIKPAFQAKMQFNTMWGDAPTENAVVINNRENNVISISDTGLVIADPSVNTNYSLANKNENIIPITYQYKIRFIDEQGNEIIETIENQTEYEIVELDDYLIEGYELDTTDMEIVDGTIYLEIDTDSEINEFILKYTKIADQEENTETNQESENQVDPSLEPENSETNIIENIEESQSTSSTNESEIQQEQTEMSNIETTTEQNSETQENVQTTSTEEQTSSD